MRQCAGAVTRLYGRQRYLSTAVGVARGEVGRPGGVDHLVGTISLADLAERVGVGRTALYKLWPSRGELWADLVAYANHGVDYRRTPAEMGLPPDPDEFLVIDLASAHWIEVIRGLTNGTVAAAAADPTWLLRAAVLAYPEEPGPAQSRRAIEAYRLGSLAARISIGVRGGQREFLEPFGIRHLAEAAWAVMDGVMVTSHWLSGLSTATIVADDGSGPLPWYLPAWAYRTTLFETTRVGRPIDRFEPDVQYVDAPRWDARRLAVLAAGTETLLERFASEHRDAALTILPHLTIDRVARAAGASRRAVYNVWGGRDAMMLDVLDELLRTEYLRLERLTGAVWPPDAPPSLDPAMLATALRSSEGDDPMLDSAITAYLPQSRHPDVRRLLVEHHQRSVDHIAAHLARLDRPLDAATRDRVAQTMIALLAGLQRVRRVHGPDGWSGDVGVTFGWTVAALCNHRPPGAR